MGEEEGEEGGALAPSVKFQPSDTNSRVQVAHNATRFEKPFRELFLWAVLMNRYELARFMWDKGEEAVSDALAACRLFQAMHDQVEDDYFEIKTALRQHAVYVQREQFVGHVINTCWSRDRRVAICWSREQCEVHDHVIWECIVRGLPQILESLSVSILSIAEEVDS